LPFYKLAYYVLFVNTCLDVLLGDHLGSQVAVKVLKDKSMVQQFLSEAYVMTYAAVIFCDVHSFSGSSRTFHLSYTCIAKVVFYDHHV